MSPYESLLSRWEEFNSLQRAVSIMSWDQQVFMPEGGGSARSEHVALLSKLAHEMLTSDEMARTLEDAESQAAPGSPEAATCRVVRREFSTQSRLPSELVSRRSKLSAASYQQWRKARPANDFASMIPHYQGLIEVNREMASVLGYTDHPYDPLHDMFEEGAKESTTRSLFEALKQPLRTIIDHQASLGPVDDSFLVNAAPNEVLVEWAKFATAAFGFDYKRGRLDLCTNAFCSTLAVGDIRMTTRGKDHLSGVVLSSMHESGHGLYEQNIPTKWDRHPLGGGISMAVHESQSRLWENIVGRSQAFWTFAYPRLQELVPSLTSVPGQVFVKGLNRIVPGPIRIGSDEVTYNLHIMLRFELETLIIEGKLEAKDLDEAWNEKTRELLGIVPSCSGDGVLQDVHWSRGSIGYFPTYAMGNLIGWQMWEVLEKDLGDPNDLMRRGEFAPILGWLRDKVYSQGKLFPPKDLVARIVGAPMSSGAYIRGMQKRYGS